MINKFLKKIIGFFGYKLVSKDLIKNTRIINNKSYLSLNKVLDLIFKKNIKSLIQIGANDGIRFDWVNKHIKKYNINALLVEPIEEYFSNLKLNYSNYNNVILEKCAISVNNEISYLYKVNTKKIGPENTHLLGVASFEIKHLLKHGVKKSDIIKESVNSMSIKNLIDKYKFYNFELLIIDAEGYDANIVIDFISSTSFRPVIILEYIHIKSIIFAKMINLLEKNNYNFFSINENLFCFPNEKDFLLSN